MLSPRRRAASVAALVALVFAGCGSGSGAEVVNHYVDQVNRAQDQFAHTVGRLSGRVTDSSTAVQDRRTLRSFTEAVDGVVADLRHIDPPAAVAPLHHELVGDIDAYGTEVKSTAAALRSQDAGVLASAQQRLLKATSTVSSQINHTIDAINRKLRES